MSAIPRSFCIIGSLGGVSADLDTIGSTRGSLLYRGAAAWSALTPGTAGFPLVSGGAGVDPSYSATPTLNTVTAQASTDLTLNAGSGANNNVNVVPVGTGVLLLGTGASVTNTLQFQSGSAIINASSTTTTFLRNSGGSNASLTIGASATTGARLLSDADGQLKFASFNGGTILGEFTSTQHLLLGGLTTDGTGVLQFPAATTSAGGIAFGTDTPMFRSSAGVIRIGDGVTGNAAMEFNGTAAASEVFTFFQAGTIVGSCGFASGTSFLFRTGAANTAALTLDSTQNATFAKKIISYNGVATTGWGSPAPYATGSVVGAVAAGNITNGAYTVGAADGDFLVSGNILVTAAIAVSTSLNVAYTDEGNTARTLIMPISGLAGSFVAGGLATSTGPFESAVLQIRAKAGTTITFSVAAGTFTSVTYNARCCIQQIA